MKALYLSLRRMNIHQNHLESIFHSKIVPLSFSGVIYLKFGTQLGDTVMELSILRMLHARYGNASFVVYVNKAWEEVLPSLERTRFKLIQKEEFLKIDQEIASEILDSTGEKLLAWKHTYMPDMYAEGKTFFESMGRIFGLDKEIVQMRPEKVLDKGACEWRNRFLEGKGLSGQPYCVVCPTVVKAKDWGRQNMIDLMESIVTILKLNVIVVGLPEWGSPEIPGVVYAYGISLREVGSLIETSSLYIGHDTGVTHMAAAFDIPLIDLFIQSSENVIPSQWRPWSPFSYGLIFPNDSRHLKNEEILRVLSLARGLLRGALQKQPECPACKKSMAFVLDATEHGVLHLCFCGLTLFSSVSGSDNPSNQPEEVLNKAIFDQNGYLIAMPSSVSRMQDMVSEILLLNPEFLEICIQIPNSCFPETYECDEFKRLDGDLTWSFDSVLNFFKNMQFNPSSISIKKLGNGKKNNFFTHFMFSKTEIPEHKTQYEIPWGGGILKINDFALYRTYFSWQTWVQRTQWNPIVKWLFSLGAKKDAYCVSKALFSVVKDRRTCGYFLLSFIQYIVAFYGESYAPKFVHEADDHQASLIERTRSNLVFQMRQALDCN